MPENKIKYDPKTAYIKAQAWCAYQERAQQEVRDKLYEWNLYPNEVEEIIAILVSEGFLNEERFAKAYVGGKFRIKQWGKIKIKSALKLKRIPANLISKALLEIPDEDYLETLQQLALKKSTEIQEKDSFKKKVKLTNYLLGKGFEKDLIFLTLKSNNLT
ncbi:MAG: RecX family transcriptional regulator [Pedobacter sp.]|nr:MAG: RecX family transcriptional regulator [Pedobacter sp.]